MVQSLKFNLLFWGDQGKQLRNAKIYIIMTKNIDYTQLRL
jgi:hypothetical protein